MTTSSEWPFPTGAAPNHEPLVTITLTEYQRLKAQDGGIAYFMGIPIDIVAKLVGKARKDGTLKELGCL